MGLNPKVEMNIHCVFYTEFNGSIKDECPYKKEGYKPCIKLGKPCKSLQGELMRTEQLFFRD